MSGSTTSQIGQTGSTPAVDAGIDRWEIWATRLQPWLPPLAALLVVIFGGALLWSGISQTAAFQGSDDTVGRLSRVSQPVVVSTPGMTMLAGSTLRVRAASSGAQQPVFIGIGRADDVDAYLGRVARAEITGRESDGALRITPRDGEASLPDPSGVDVWAAETKTLGMAELAWPRTPGRWRLVIATDGRTPPSAAELRWSGSSGSSPAPALIAIGAVLLVVGLAGLGAMRTGRLFAGGPLDQAESDRSGGGRSGPDREAELRPVRSGRRRAVPRGGARGPGAGSGANSAGAPDVEDVADEQDAGLPAPGSRRALRQQERAAADTGTLQLRRLRRSEAAPPRVSPTRPTSSDQPASEPSMSEPSMSEPSMSEPSMSEPSMSEPSMSEPSMSEPVPADRPAVEQAPAESAPVEPPRADPVTTRIERLAPAEPTTTQIRRPRRTDPVPSPAASPPAAPKPPAPKPPAPPPSAPPPSTPAPTIRPARTAKPLEDDSGSDDEETPVVVKPFRRRPAPGRED